MKCGYQHRHWHGTRQIQKNEDTDTAGDTANVFLIYYIYEKLHQQT